MKSVGCLLLLFLLTFNLFSQILTQTVRGKVLDEDAKSPLIGVNIKLSDGATFYGGSTDLEGNFKIQKVPVGRYLIEVSYIGYEPKSIPNLAVDAGKEKVMTIQLTESLQQLEAITVTGKKEKHEAKNEMALVSTRSFSVEETKRYAGAANDPARMASSFAGVSSRSADATNEIIIRGNSPRGLLWRINGIEVPNPNHFATEGAGGGGISVINSNVLSNSDFYTGAFPAEYGNAFSGIFDIGFRKGNNEKYEYAIKGGFLGSDVSIEGPLNRKSGGSFLVNYRYSTLSIMEQLGILDLGSSTNFQDLTYHVDMPTEKYGTFSTYALFSKSSQVGDSDYLVNDSVYNADGSFHIRDTTIKGKEKFQYDMAALGLTNTYFLNDKTYLKSYVAFDQVAFHEEERSLDRPTYKTYVDDRTSISNRTVRASINLNKKINARNSFKAGLIQNTLFYDLDVQESDSLAEPLRTTSKENSNTTFNQAYVSWKHKITQQLIFTTGMHFSYFTLNEELLVEPRAAIKWQFNPLQSISLGAGMHSRHESISAYFGQTVNANGEVVRPNKDLEQTKAIHYVLGYDHKITEQLYFKAEAYYQDLYDVGVETNKKSAYSALNQNNTFTTRDLTGKGTGENYGLELTLEKYFSNTYYFLLSASLYESTYKGSDGIKHDTKYNGNHLVNLAIGKEFSVGNEKKQRTLVLNCRTTVAGNNRYTSIDLEKSREAGETVLVQGKRYDQQFAMYSRVDFSIALIRQKKKSTREWKVDVLNALGQETENGIYYAAKRGTIEMEKNGVLIPILSYQVKF